MRRYLLSSAGIHFSLLGAFLLFGWFHRSNDFLMIDGFDYVGSGGGGDGRAGSGGIPAKNMGQVVPMPIKVPVPAKPAPIQKPVAAEQTWSVKNPKTAPTPKETAKPDTPIERAEKPQKEQSNVIRLGVPANTQPSEGGFDFGTGKGGGGGEGDGKGLGLGIGFGPGEGGGFGGFGGYLRILRERIWSEWAQTAVYGSNEVCIVGLTVARSGDVSEIKVEKPSNNPFYDNVALRAVRNASPLPPLPSSFSRDSQRFRIKFRLIE